ncbi:hypothetical protein MK424_01935 [Streptococcus oralis]|uniref:DUF7716 domain-containing protein n=1 Tax=Streptococcus oralis TaxID=1303 RepID=UPI002283E002|nr:hypothetical protein [Streptococcus oralis]MCY7076750.1 hypothetical protein [Streptococcus oralis]
MRKHQFFSLTDILEQVKLEQCTQDDFCLYGNDEGDLALDSLYLVSDYPDVVDDKDVYPVEVVEKNLNLVYYGEQLIDVLIVALDEKPGASPHDLVDALNYYNWNDTFMPFA